MTVAIFLTAIVSINGLTLDCDEWQQRTDGGWQTERATVLGFPQDGQTATIKGALSPAEEVFTDALNQACGMESPHD